MQLEKKKAKGKSFLGEGEHNSKPWKKAGRPSPKNADRP
jgi:hypothetical protein